MHSGFTFRLETGGEYMEKDRQCEFYELCEDCHPETEMAEKRKTCDSERCKRCGVYWAFRDGYLGLDEE